MKRFITAAIALMALAVSASGQFHYGLRAGYELNTQIYNLKDAHVFIHSEPNHGFYFGPQFEYDILPGKLAVSGAIVFQKTGGNLSVDLNKITENGKAYRETANEMSDKNNPSDEGHVIRLAPARKAAEINEGDPLIPISGDPITMLALGNTAKASVSRYNASVPISLKYKSGNFGVLAGITLNYTLFTDIRGKVRWGGEEKTGAAEVEWTQKDLNEAMGNNFVFMYADLYGADKVKFTEDGEPVPMTVNEFYDKVINQHFTLGAQVGVEYAITKNLAVQALYQRSFLNNIKKPFNKLIFGGDQAIQIGLVYNFQ